MHRILQPYATFSGVTPKKTLKLRVDAHPDTQSFSVPHSEGVYHIHINDPLLFSLINTVLAGAQYYYLTYARNATQSFKSIHKGLQEGDPEGIKVYTLYIDQTMDHFQPLLKHTYENHTCLHYEDAIVSVLQQQYLDRRQKTPYEHAYPATIKFATTETIKQRVNAFCFEQTPELLLNKHLYHQHSEHQHLVSRVTRQYHFADDILRESHAIDKIASFRLDKTVFFHVLHSGLRDRPDLMKKLFIDGFQFYHVKDQNNHHFLQSYMPQLTASEQEAWWTHQTAKHQDLWLDFVVHKQHPVLLPILQRIAPEKVQQWQHFHTQLNNLRIIDPSMASAMYKKHRCNIDAFEDFTIEEVPLHY